MPHHAYGKSRYPNEKRPVAGRPFANCGKTPMPYAPKYKSASRLVLLADGIMRVEGVAACAFTVG
jgi:hypothetical protein